MKEPQKLENTKNNDNSQPENNKIDIELLKDFFKDEIDKLNSKIDSNNINIYEEINKMFYNSQKNATNNLETAKTPEKEEVVEIFEKTKRF